MTSHLENGHRPASTSTLIILMSHPAAGAGFVHKDISDCVLAMVQTTAQTAQFMCVALIAVGAYEWVYHLDGLTLEIYWEFFSATVI
jgi:hypothetical protein